jgi:hypothetical protein
MALSGTWNYPTPIRFGAGRISELPQACAELGITRPLLVTDPVLSTLPICASTVQVCADAGLAVTVSDQCARNPTAVDVAAGIAAYRASGSDGVIAFGGGAAIDVAKAVALMVGQDRPLWDFEDVGDNWTRVLTESVAP